jgi:hypothetical protein
METPKDELVKLLEDISDGLDFLAQTASSGRTETQIIVLKRYARLTRQAADIQHELQAAKERPTLAESQRQLADGTTQHHGEPMTTPESRDWQLLKQKYNDGLATASEKRLLNIHNKASRLQNQINSNEVEGKLAGLLGEMSEGLGYIAETVSDKSPEKLALLLKRYSRTILDAAVIARARQAAKERPTLAESQLRQPPVINPFLGLKPRPIAEQERFAEVVGAIRRLVDQDRPVPREWLEEYEDLHNRCTYAEAARARFIENEMGGSNV